MNTFTRFFVKIAAFIPIFFLNSCLPEELPVAPFPRGDLKNATISMGSDYHNQVYFDFSKDTSVGVFSYDTWDIAFESAPKGFRIFLNSAQSASAALTSAKEFSATITDSLLFRNDASSGAFDSLAIGGAWADTTSGSTPLSRNTVYVIDRGFDYRGKVLGKWKMQILGVNALSYTIRFAKLTGENEQILTVPKESAFRMTYFSFASAKTVQTQMPTTDWDIVFTKYMFLFYVPELSPYSVTGVLQNLVAGVAVASDTLRPFAEITAADVEKYVFKTSADAIGFEWKYFNINTNSYTVNQKTTYIIRDRKGFFYKMRFLDFYNDKGIRGYPKFEYQRI